MQKRQSADTNILIVRCWLSSKRPIPIISRLSLHHYYQQQSTRLSGCSFQTSSFCSRKVSIATSANCLSLAGSSTNDGSAIFCTQIRTTCIVVSTESTPMYTSLLHPSRGAEYCDQFVCVCVCMSLELLDWAARFFVQIPCGRGSVLFWRCLAVMVRRAMCLRLNL